VVFLPPSDNHSNSFQVADDRPYRDLIDPFRVSPADFLRLIPSIARCRGNGRRLYRCEDGVRQETSIWRALGRGLRSKAVQFKQARRELPHNLTCGRRVKRT
jgi:hypothetical protein